MSLILIIIKRHFVMAKKFNYDSEALLNIMFSPSNAGYDADEVDDVFEGDVIDGEVEDK